MLMFESINSFEWINCGHKDTIAFTKVLSFTPSPLKFGHDVHIDASFKVIRTLPKDAIVGFEMWRRFSLFGIPFDVRMPCLFGGECKSNLCSFVRSWDLACSIVQQSRSAVNSSSDLNPNCDCPVTEGVYEGFGYKRKMPNGNAFVSLLGSGTYKVRVRMFDPSKSTVDLACLEAIESVY